LQAGKENSKYRFAYYYFGVRYAAHGTIGKPDFIFTKSKILKKFLFLGVDISVFRAFIVRGVIFSTPTRQKGGVT
jgi:hypothetical protein